MPDDYSLQKHMYYSSEVKRLTEENLPSFCADYFRAMLNNTEPLTRYAYAHDLILFFNYLVNENKSFSGVHPKDLTVKDMNKVTALDIELFLEYISVYSRETVSHDYDGKQTVTSKITMNMESGRARKLAAIRSLFKYLYKRGLIDNTPAAIVDTPKIHDKPIIRLEAHEVDRLFDVILNAEGMSERQKKHLEHTKIRDIAIVTLFLGTGIRISELVGIDLEDINFVSDEFSITRKGGKKDVLVFGEEVRRALLAYISEREKISAVPGHEKALFLSTQKKRITVRAVENLVKKYAQVAAPQKHITPHKLRSTFGTMLYDETGDIYLVADVLGHKDVNTTRKHYAAIAKERRRIAADVIKVHADGEDPFENNMLPQAMDNTNADEQF